MLKRSLLFCAAIFLATMPVKAENTSLQALQGISKPTNTSNLTSPISKEHWAYKTMEEISKKNNLKFEPFYSKTDGAKALSRNEAALLLVNLVGKIEQNKLELNEAEKAEIKILKQEFQSEINELIERVASVETTVDGLKGRITNLEENSNKNLKFDYGDSFKLNGALQAQFTGNFQKGSDQYPSNFLLPYSEVKITGKLTPHIDYKAIMVPTRLYDESNGNGTITSGTTKNGMLDDMYISTDIIPHHNVYLGQTRIPIGYEGPMSPLDVETIDKSQISRNFSDTLDLGVKAKGNWDFFEYSIGAYNGSGLNKKDTNSGMDIASWAVIKPLYKSPQLGSLELGGGYDIGKNTSFNHNTTSFYSGYKYKKYSLRGEYAFSDGYLTSGTKSRGWYIHNAYSLTNKLQLVGRFDTFDPNTKSYGNTNTEYTLGSNYLVKDNVMLMAGYVFVHNKSGNSNRIEALTQVLF